MKRRTSPRRASSGFAYALKIGFISTALLVINTLLVRAYINANPPLREDIRLTQVVQFIVPLLMILIQFWVFDYLRDHMSGRAPRKTDRETETEAGS